MKKRFLFGVVAIACMLLMTVLIHNRSKPIAMIKDSKSINAITVNDQKIVDEMIVSELIDLLQEYMVVETSNPFPMATDKIDIEIDYTDQHKPKHIILGEVNIIYESADEKVYRIIDAEQLQLEIKKYLE